MRYASALILVAAAALAACSRPAAHASPQIRLAIPPDNPSRAVVEVIGLPDRDLAALDDAAMSREDWSRLLRVSVKRDAGAGPGEPPPAMLGTHVIAGHVLRFTPQFPFDPGRQYEVTLDPSRLPSGGEPWRGRPIVAIVSRPAAVARARTVVERVYPSATMVPENQLRLYIHFSAPMGLRGGLDHIKLLDETGTEIQDPFLPLDAEFWNDDRTRYTVFFDPGRVKRGILPNERMGRPLRAGHTYTLVVDGDWHDAQGLPLRETFRRPFRVGSEDQRPLETASWTVGAPRAGSRDPLVVAFPEPLDHGLLMRALGVATREGKPIAGESRVEAAETRWLFVPRDSWQAGEHRLIVLPILEDLAGNRIGRAFEVDRFDRADAQPEPESIQLPFRVGR